MDGIRCRDGARRPRSGRHVRTKVRKRTVKVLCGAVRKVSTKVPSGAVAINFKLTLPPRTALWLTSMRSFSMHANRRSNGDKMGVLIFVLLTVAVFAVLGLVQKLVERL